MDYRLPVTAGLSMFNVLQSRGVPSRFLSFPDENHVSRQLHVWLDAVHLLTPSQWVLKPENSLVWHSEVLGWINKYTQPDNSGVIQLIEEVDRVRI